MQLQSHLRAWGLSNQAILMLAKLHKQLKVCLCAER